MMINNKLAPSSAQVLATAIHKLKDDINIKPDDLAEIMGIHRNTLDRILKKGELEPDNIQGQLALLLIRVYRALFALHGGDREAMIHWLNTSNYHIQGIPLEQMKNIMGLAKVVNYLDAMRGKV